MFLKLNMLNLNVNRCILYDNWNGLIHNRNCWSKASYANSCLLQPASYSMEKRNQSLARKRIRFLLPDIDVNNKYTSTWNPFIKPMIWLYPAFMEKSCPVFWREGTTAKCNVTCFIFYITDEISRLPVMWSELLVSSCRMKTHPLGFP